MILCAMLLAGCGTTKEFARPTAEWTTHVGQLKYSTSKRSIIGDVVVRTHGADQFQLDFLAGPGVPLMSLRQDGNRTQASGPLAIGGPYRWKSWASLRERFVAMPKGARELRVDDAARGEHFIFLFNR